MRNKSSNTAISPSSSQGRAFDPLQRKVQFFDVPKHVNHAEQLSDENDIPDLLQALHHVRVSGTLRLRAFDEQNEVVRKVLVHLTLGSTEARLNYSSYLRKLATLQRLRCDLHLRLFRP